MSLVLQSQLLAKVNNTFTYDNAPTALYGVHELKLPGNLDLAYAFTNGNKTVYVHAFYDGNGYTRARFYCDKLGTWSWFNNLGETGSFEVVTSPLKGKLKASGKFFTRDNGEAFISIADTGYHLFNKNKTIFTDFKQYIEDIEHHGATIVRIAVAGSIHYVEHGGSNDVNLINSLYNSSGTEFNYTNFNIDDERIKWMLENHPDLQIQLILLGANDSTLYSKNRDALLQYMIDRYSAYPNIIFLVHNDAFYDYTTKGTKKRTIAREALSKLNASDPFGTLRTTGFVRLDTPERQSFMKWYWDDFIKENSTYMHLETRSDVAADNMDIFRQHDDSVPIVNMEDLYEGRDIVSNSHEIYANSEERFFRRGHWSWILSGSGFAYGGNWWSSEAYSSGTSQLKGMDDLKHIGNFFKDNTIDYSKYFPDDSMATNGFTGINRVQAMKNLQNYILYTPVNKDIIIDELQPYLGYVYTWMNPETGDYLPFQSVIENTFIFPSMYGFNYDGVLFVKAADKPAIPKNIFISNIKNNTVEFHFNTSNVNVAGYKIYEKNKLVAIIDSQTSKYEFTGLNSNENYIIIIKAYNAGGESGGVSFSFKTKKEDYNWLPAIYHITL